MEKEAAVVIPYHHNDLSSTEQVSYEQCRKVLYNYRIIFVVPEGLEVSVNKFPLKWDVITVPPQWMSSVEAYNQMMLNKTFYGLFHQYQYILIYQLDAYVFSDRLLEFCSLGYDYIGAPWLEGKFDMKHEENGVLYVGNGGFSLRKIDSFLSVLENCGHEYIDYNEDLFWASRNSESFRIAPVNAAIDFAFERPVRLLYEKNNNSLPFGCHAWMKYDFQFFKPYLIRDGYDLMQDYQPVHEYDRSNRYIDQKYMLADETHILWAFQELFQIMPDIIYIYGVGYNGKLCGCLLKKIHGSKIKYLDRNELMWGDKIYGFSVMPPDDVKEDPRAVIIMTIRRYGEELEWLAGRKYTIGENIVVFDSFVDSINKLMNESKV